MTRIVVEGQGQRKYASSKVGNLSKPACLNTRILVTENSFEIGEAHSLHAIKKVLEHYSADWWSHACEGARQVSFSESTSKAIAKSGQKCLFKGLED